MYIVMEFVSGSSLEKTLQEEDLGLVRAVELIGQIASGLDAAHAQGIIHRDIKPSNILLTGEGTAKIADFGITRVESSCLTQDMRELWTPAYMSPEQVNGKVLDSRSDLFSLGVLSYEILAGRKPFEGTDAVSMAYAIAHAQHLPISVANPAVPQALDRVMDRILAKESSERFASGRDFHEACLECLPERGVPRSPTPTRASRRRTLALLGLAGAAALAVAVVWSSRGQRTPSSAPATPKAAPATTATAARAASPIRKKQAALQAPAKPAIESPRTPPAAAKPPLLASVTEAASSPQPVPMADVTISLGHRLRQGTLVVFLDGVVIFDESFSKSKLAVFQTTRWDPLRAPAGGHKLSAKVNGEDGKIYLSDAYTVEFPRGKAVALRFGFKGDSLTVKQKSG